MQTKLSNVQYDCLETISHEIIECPIDLEYSLPDYCPNIQKIIKSIPTVNLTSYSFTQDRIMCEGELILHVQYLDENSEIIRVCEIHKDFSHARELTQSEYKTFGKLSASAGHIVCRAISARKLDIHIPVILNVNLLALKENKINCDAEDLEKKTEKIRVSHITGFYQQIFTLEEELELSKSSAPIDSIYRKEILINSTKYSIVNDKVILEATAELTLFYRSFSEEFTTEKMKYAIPFSESFDINNVDTNNIICHEINLCEFSVQPKEDENGEYTVCDLYAKMNVNIAVYEDKEIDLIVDAYSTTRNCQYNYDNISLLHLRDQSEEKFNISKSIFLSEDELEKVIDFWCEDVSVTPYCEKNKINYRGKFNITFIYKGKSKQFFSVTKSFDFTNTKDFDDFCQRKCEATLSANIKDYRIIDGNNLEFSCEIILKSTDFQCNSKKILINAQYSDNERVKTKNSIKIYYGKKGESLWEIGKNYSCPVTEIIENNKLSDAEYSNGEPLLIF